MYAPMTRDLCACAHDHWQDVEMALNGSNHDGLQPSGGSIFEAESYTFMCTSSTSRSGSQKSTRHPLADPRNSTAQLPSLLQSCISSMLAGEYSVFVVPTGADKEWDQAMLSAGCGSSCHFVQLAMIHFQRRSVCVDKSTAAVTIVRHSNMWSTGHAPSALQSQSPTLVSASIGDGTVIVLSYAVRSCSGCQWSEVARSRQVTVGSADLPMGLDAAVRSMQVHTGTPSRAADHDASSRRWQSCVTCIARRRTRMLQRCQWMAFQTVLT
jgi:hypothetical protein